MRSHIHELWEDLELSPLYPEPAWTGSWTG